MTNIRALAYHNYHTIVFFLVTGHMLLKAGCLTYHCCTIWYTYYFTLLYLQAGLAFFLRQVHHDGDDDLDDDNEAATS